MRAPSHCINCGSPFNYIINGACRRSAVEADDEEGGVVVGGDAHAEAVEVGEEACAEVRGVGRVDGGERGGDAGGFATSMPAT